MAEANDSHSWKDKQLAKNFDTHEQENKIVI